MEYMQRLEACLKSVREKTDFVPEIAVVLGSGLGDFADGIDQRSVINYSEIESFPLSTAPGHKGRFVFGYVENVPVVIMQGRIHYYEGYPMGDVVLPTRLMKMMGASTLFLTNAAGGVNFTYEAGDFMLISDHISTFVPSPLIGKNLAELGTRFPDMSEIYDKSLRAIIKKAAAERGIPLREGVYIQFTGPQYENPAEIRMCRALGADAVGMSTVCEAIAARHAGMRVAALSCIANLACGMSSEPLSEQEVLDAAAKAAPSFKELLTASIAEMGSLATSD